MQRHMRQAPLARVLSVPLLDNNCGEVVPIFRDLPLASRRNAAVRAVNLDAGNFEVGILEGRGVVHHILVAGLDARGIGSPRTFPHLPRPCPAPCLVGNDLHLLEGLGIVAAGPGESSQRRGGPGRGARSASGEVGGERRAAEQVDRDAFSRPNGDIDTTALGVEGLARSSHGVDLQLILTQGLDRAAIRGVACITIRVLQRALESRRRVLNIAARTRVQSHRVEVALVHDFEDVDLAAVGWPLARQVTQHPQRGPGAVSRRDVDDIHDDDGADIEGLFGGQADRVAHRLDILVVDADVYVCGVGEFVDDETSVLVLGGGGSVDVGDIAHGRVCAGEEVEIIEESIAGVVGDEAILGRGGCSGRSDAGPSEGGAQGGDRDISANHNGDGVRVGVCKVCQSTLSCRTLNAGKHIF